MLFNKFRWNPCIAVFVSVTISILGSKAFAQDPNSKPSDKAAPNSNLGQPSKEKKAAAATPKGNSFAIRNQELRRKLLQPMDIERALQAPVRDIIEYLEERLQVEIQFDPLVHLALKEANPPVDNFEDVPVRLPKTKDVPLNQVLQDIFAQFAVRPSLSVIVKAGQVRVVPNPAMQEAAPISVAGNTEPQRGFGISNQFHVEEKSLVEALASLSDLTGVNIVLDPRTKEYAKETVSISMQNAPVLTIVRILADSADLRVAILDNVLYVTTPENAIRIAREHQPASRPAAPKPAATTGK